MALAYRSFILTGALFGFAMLPRGVAAGESVHPAFAGTIQQPITTHAAFALCQRGKAATIRVAVHGQLLLQARTGYSLQVRGVLFDQIHLPAGAQYSRRWISYGGLFTVIPSHLFRRLRSLGRVHPPVVWIGRLQCRGALSVLHATNLAQPLPASGG